MNGVNKVILVGRLGGDPEVRYTAGGAAVATLSVATSESWTDKQTGEKREKTEWHRVVYFERLAEVAGEYLRKGSMIFVGGQLRTRKWQDKDGQDRYTTEVVGRELQMLSAKQGGESSAQSAQGEEQPRQGFRDNPKQEPKQGTLDDGFSDDDIPF